MLKRISQTISYRSAWFTNSPRPTTSRDPAALKPDRQLGGCKMKSGIGGGGGKGTALYGPASILFSEKRLAAQELHEKIHPGGVEVRRILEVFDIQRRFHAIIPDANVIDCR